MPGRQPKIQLVLGRDPRRLLEAAADGFLRHRPGTPDRPFPSPDYLLALRQGGLRDDLVALAAERGVPGWFDPPLCIFHELPERLGATVRRPCDDFERLVILGGVLRRTGGDVFGPARLERPEAFLGALDRLIGELASEGVAPDAFRRALESRRGRDEFERGRDHELALIYRDYLATLERHGRRDGRDGWLDCARALAADPEGLARRLGGRREIRLFGLMDLRGGWRALLRTLADSPAVDRIVIYTAEELTPGEGLPVQVTRLQEPETFAARLFAEPASETAGDAARPEVRVLAAPDVERELDEVARRVRDLADRGVPLRRIAVVSHSARPYMDLAVAALERFGVPAAARRRHALREVPVVRALRALFAAAADGWSRHALAELAEQPYFASDESSKTGLDARVVNFAGFRARIAGLDGWKAALRRLSDEAVRAEAEAEARRAKGEAGDEPAWRHVLPPSARVREAVDGFGRFAARARDLDRQRTLAGWLDWLHAFLTDDPWRMGERIRDVPAGRWDVVRLDLAGWEGLARIVARWREALEAWGGAEDRLDAAAFYQQLDQLLDGDVALWTPAHRGVQVLEGFAAAYRGFDHVFLVGLEAGRFPARAPGSPILDESDRLALAGCGLPLEPAEEWEARERELFRILAAGAGSLTVSYARLDADGRETVRSAFVEALGDVCTLVGAEEEDEIPARPVLVPGARLLAPAAAAHAEHAARVELDRMTGRPSPHNGVIEDPELRAWLAGEFGDGRVWSPTQLESFAKCPWSYFSARLLRVSRQEDPDEEMDPAARGQILHDALRRFYEKAQARTGGPVFLREKDLEWAYSALDVALAEAVAAAQVRQWLGHPLLLDAKRAEMQRTLRRFLAAEVREHEDMYNPRKKVAKRIRTGVVQHELVFDEATLERGGVTFRFRGAVDRVETGMDDRFPSAHFLVAVDYKSSKHAAPGAGRKEAWDDGVVLQIPLYAHALAAHATGRQVARIEYRALKQCEPAHPLELFTFDKGAGAAVPEAEEIEKMEAALDAVARHVLRARRGEFPAEPAESCGCPPFCHALEICRVKGGPRVGH